MLLKLFKYLKTPERTELSTGGGLDLLGPGVGLPVARLLTLGMFIGSFLYALSFFIIGQLSNEGKYADLALSLVFFSGVVFSWYLISKNSYRKAIAVVCGLASVSIIVSAIFSQGLWSPELSFGSLIIIFVTWLLGLRSGFLSFTFFSVFLIVVGFLSPQGGPFGQEKYMLPIIWAVHQLCITLSIALSWLVLDKFTITLQREERARNALGLKEQEARIGEERLWHLNTHLQAILNATAYAVIVLNNKGEIVSFTKGAQHLLGYEESSVLGKQLDFFYEKHAQNMQVEGDLDRFAEDLNLKHNSSVEDFYDCFAHDEQQSVVKNVARLVGCEQGSHSNHFEDRKLVKNIMLQHLKIDTSSESVESNDGEQDVKKEDCLADDYANYSFLKIALLLKKLPGKIVEFNKYLKCQNEKSFVAKVAISSLKDARGNLDGFVAVIADISAQEQAKKSLRDMNEKLKNTLQVRVGELEQTLNKLMQSEKLAALGSMVAGVSHEMSTPIGNALLGSSTCINLISQLEEMLKSGQVKRTELDSKLKQLNDGLQIVESGLLHASGVMESFKSVSVSQSNEHFATFDLIKVLHSHVQLFSLRLKRQKIQIQIISPARLMIKGDAGKLGQVVSILLSNALEHAFDKNFLNKKEGQITIRVETNKDGSSPLLIIRFSDNGLGFDEKYINRAFEPFFTTKMAQGGTGLGLPIAKNIIESYWNGQIEVESKTNEGTTFIVSIPLPLFD